MNVNKLEDNNIKLKKQNNTLCRFEIETGFFNSLKTWTTFERPINFNRREKNNNNN